MKRTENLSWDQYFMGIARLSAERSKDPSTQVGTCIINHDNKIVGIGYNGFPTGISDDDLPWSRDGGFLDTKYPYVCHAEMNGILNSTQSLKGCSMYVTLFPCNECAKLIIQSGIQAVIYLSDKYSNQDNIKASKILLGKAGIATKQYETKQKEIRLLL